MAERPVFISQCAFPYVKTISTEFKFYPGFALSQSRKSIESLHDHFIAQHPEYGGLILEVSSKSDKSIGVHLSAFNLMYTLSDGRKRFVENVFQSGKCFANGGSYTEILEMSAAEAKNFQRLRTSGDIVSFQLEGKLFPIEPKTYFYDWLYVNALYQNQILADEVVAYRAFTDIAFNPAKSLNCQARSVALFVALRESGMLSSALCSPESFLKIAYDVDAKNNLPKEDAFEQLSLF